MTRMNMNQLLNLIRPTWAAEKWLINAWSKLSEEEQATITVRMDEMFCNGLPVQLKHDKILYIHLFSLLTQLESVGLHLLLKPIEQFKGTSFEGQLRQQFMDEIFHASIFAKITYELSAPYALPPVNNKDVEKIITLVLNEPDYKTSLILISLIAEGLIEEIFTTIKDIAPRVVETILMDESRHLTEFELFRQTGLPDKAYLKERITLFEAELINIVFNKKEYVGTFMNSVGLDKLIQLIQNIDKKQKKALSSLGIKSSDNWQFFINNLPQLIKHLAHDQVTDKVVTQTMTRKILSSLWNDPDQPTQYGNFSVNITPLGFFEKKYPSATLTCLVLQTISKVLSDHPELKHYMSHHKIYSMKDSYVGLAVLLPGCGDHLGMIEFKNCHEMNILALSKHIQHDLEIMTYCYHKTTELQQEHPYFTEMVEQLFPSKHSEIYDIITFANPAISVSNIGNYGYNSVGSPLFPFETVKFTVNKVERKQVWNTKANAFEVQDILSVDISVDHRVFDANQPIPKLFQTAFNEMFHLMQQNSLPMETNILNPLNLFIQYSEEQLAGNAALGFQYLLLASQVWKNYLPFSEHSIPQGLIEKIKNIVDVEKSS
jgi:hypothetical protein